MGFPKAQRAHDTRTWIVPTPRNGGPPQNSTRTRHSARFALADSPPTHVSVMRVMANADLLGPLPLANWRFSDWRVEFYQIAATLAWFFAHSASEFAFTDTFLETKHKSATLYLTATETASQSLAFAPLQCFKGSSVSRETNNNLIKLVNLLQASERRLPDGN